MGLIELDNSRSALSCRASVMEDLEIANFSGREKSFIEAASQHQFAPWVRDAVMSSAMEEARMAGLRGAAAASSLACGVSVADRLTASGVPSGLSYYADSIAQTSDDRLYADITKENVLGAAMSLREEASRQAMEASSDALRRMQAESYRNSAESWLSGNRWQPATHSILHGIESKKAAAIDTLIHDWRHKPGYADIFSTLATISDAMIAARGGLGSYASLVGDVRSLVFSDDFEYSPQARLNAYRNIGFDMGLLKPNQHALATMLTLNGYVDPNLWQRDGRLIVPVKRLDMKARLKELKPTRLQTKAYREVGALERWLRAFIDDQMSSTYGEDWYETYAPKKLLNRIKSKSPDNGEICGMFVLDDADFAHYIEIILHETHWVDVFSYIFSDREETEGMLNLFKKLRIAVAHFKGFSKADFSQLRVYARWFEAQTEGI